MEAKLFKSNKIGTEHLLLAILKDDDNVVTQVLGQLGVDYDAVKEELEMSNALPEAEFPGSPTDEPDDEDAWKIQPEDIGKLVVDLLQMNPRTLPSKIEVRPSIPPVK